MAKLVYGVGINDAIYTTQPMINGKQVVCPYYRTWKDMIRRCYSTKYYDKRPTYEGCSVADEWLVFSKFKAWMETQDWEGNQLDKDILLQGNRIYSKDTCAFVSGSVNSFVLNNQAIRGEYKIGVSYNKQS